MIYTLLSVLFLLTVISSISIYHLIKIRKKYKETIESLKDINSKKILRTGYYEDSLNLVNKDGKGDLYKCFITVNELDRYTNGESKIEIVDIVVNGYNPSQYRHVSDSMKKRFIPIYKTNDIEWLESETDIEKVRREKIKKIIESSKK